MDCKFKSWLDPHVSSISALNKAVGGQAVVLCQGQGLKGSINPKGYSGRAVSISLSYSNHVNVHIPKILRLHIFILLPENPEKYKRKGMTADRLKPLYLFGAQGRSRTGTEKNSEGF